MEYTDPQKLRLRGLLRSLSSSATSQTSSRVTTSQSNVSRPKDNRKGERYKGENEVSFTSGLAQRDKDIAVAKDNDGVRTKLGEVHANIHKDKHTAREKTMTSLFLPMPRTGLRVPSLWEPGQTPRRAEGYDPLQELVSIQRAQRGNKGKQKDAVAKMAGSLTACACPQASRGREFYLRPNSGWRTERGGTMREKLERR
jgi:hypothetical protein